MTDKNVSKFPYIVLPSLSEEKKNISAESGPKESLAKSGSIFASATPNNAKLSKGVAMPSVVDNQHNSNGATPPSKGLSRHLALSKQFGGSTPANNSVPKTTSLKSSKELQLMRQEMLKAHYELRKSPRSFYLYEGDGDGSNPILESPKTSDEQLGGSTKLDLEALSQILPHRSRQRPPSKTKDEVKSVKSSRKSVSLATVVNVHNMKAALEKVVNASSSTSSVSTAASTSCSSELDINQLKTRIDGLTVHVKQKDMDFSKLKENVIELQLMILKEKKESERSNELMERLSTEIESLTKKLDSVETKLINQEASILNKLLLIDEMGSSESDSEYGRIECKPSSWMATSSSSNTTSIPSKVQSSSSIANQNQNQTNQNSGINSLKECVNWVPIAPDFDKLLNVIYLLNFRMDRNQSMKLARNGNEATFKHADTIQMKLFKNGLILGNSGFRSYATLSVIKLINELFNGYFPTELHSQYPDGVVFVITDKRSIVHHLSPGFNCPGMKLSDSKSVPVLLPGATRFCGTQKKLEVGSSASSRFSCVSLPLNFSTQSLACVSLPDLCKTCPKGHKMIVLKLKNVSMAITYKLRLSTSNTINQVLEHFSKHYSSEEGESLKTPPKFDIILPVPYGILTSGTSTLKEYGFITNILLYIQQSEPDSAESAQDIEPT